MLLIRHLPWGLRHSPVFFRESSTRIVVLVSVARWRDLSDIFDVALESAASVANEVASGARAGLLSVCPRV